MASVTAVDAATAPPSEAAPPVVTVPATEDAAPPLDAAIEPADASLNPAPRFESAVLVAALASEDKDDNPTLTEDLKEIYFTSTRAGNTDVWVAQRDSAEDEFGEPVPVDAVNSDEFESSPAIDPDGLTLWFGSAREGGAGGVDIWVSRRPTRTGSWGAPELAAELNSSEDDIPRPVGDRGLSMPLASRRAGGDYLTYIAHRASPNAAFAVPVLIESLVTSDSNTADGFLLPNDAGILFAHASDDKGDLYFATRTGTVGFGQSYPIASLNTDADERDPWLSVDGKYLYFASDRAGTLQIYVALRVADAAP